jgi:hypothetical protein
VRYVDIRGKGHETSAADSEEVTLDWIDARFEPRATITALSPPAIKR